MKCQVHSEIQTWDLWIPKRRRYHYRKGSDLKVRKNQLCHYIPPPFEERRLMWSDSIYHSAVAYTLSCSKQAYIYTTEESIVCDEICIHTFHTNCMDFFSTSLSPMKCRVRSEIRTRCRDINRPPFFRAAMDQLTVVSGTHFS